MTLRRSLWPAELALAATTLLTACGADTFVTAPPVPSETRTLTVDASAGYAYIALDTIAQVVNVTNPATSTAWDIGVFATGVTTNGGAAGPGGVGVYCLCEHASATTAEIQAMTTANQLAMFDSVTSTALPPLASFASDQLDPVINGWYTGAGATAAVATGKSWIVRKTVGNATILAKFHVTTLSGPTTDSPGLVTFEFAIQPSAGAAFGAIQTVTMPVTAGTPAYFDLSANAVGSAAAWDIAFDGWNIRSNGGVSGSGTVMAVLDATTPFASITATYAASAPPQAYRGDTFSGVFAGSPWYRYNITGSDNQIWPVYNVYLVRRGSHVFKVQLTGYYSATGAPRNITIRYAKILGS